MVESDNKVAEDVYMLQEEEEENLGRVGEEKCLDNEASPGLRRSKGRVSR